MADHTGGSDMAPSPTTVIVGAGFAGIEAAEALGRAGHAFILIDQRNYHLFQPLLYQVATSTLQPAEIAAPVRALVSRYPQARVILDRVVNIDPARRVVETEARSFAYDRLILATGARTSYFGDDALAEHSFALKSLDDALHLRHQILMAFERAEMAEDEDTRKALMSFVLVGAGPNGVGAAVAIRELASRTLARDFNAIDPRQARILILEAADTILPGLAPEFIEEAAAILENKGVEIRTGAKVSAIDADGVTVDGERIAAGTTIWTAGVEVPDLADWLDAEADKKGRIKVCDDLTVPGRPEIHVVGDAALVMDGDGKPLPGLAAVAKQEGRHAAAAVITARDGGPHGGGSHRPFRYADYGHMVPLGRFSAVAEIKGRRLKGLPAWVVWAAAHIFFLMDWRRRLVVAFTWLWSLATSRTGSRIIINRQGVELPAPTRKAERGGTTDPDAEA
jgi:NADH:ubiquinone reductase (H+-translocating)